MTAAYTHEFTVLKEDSHKTLVDLDELYIEHALESPHF
jgi:hypothetical protein